MRAAGWGYHFPVLFGEDSKKIWALRKAGLGLLSNLPGDEKAVPVIEDTAVDVEDLPAYIAEFNQILKKHGLYSVHYAHAGSGELHLRPIINLKTEQGNKLFRVIAEEVATLVKKYKGSLSGEHGDGRLRGEFIRQMIGEKNYKLLKEVKNIWDPQHIFNPNKIVDTPSMNAMLRYVPGHFTPEFKTIFRFHQQNILQHAEQCNGSGDCRKTHLSGGTMCPSYMATRDEKDTTRARANILREYLTNSNKENRFDHQEIYDVMGLCLSCKACKSECPSNVDMAKLKAEFLQHYYDANGVPFRARLIANFTKASALGSLVPSLYNAMVKNGITGNLIKRLSGFAIKRSMPLISKQTLKSWYKENKDALLTKSDKELYLFCDEFTNYNDAEIGIKAIKLLTQLGYAVKMVDHEESGRTWLSKGLVRKAKEIANKNIELFAAIIDAQTPLIGLEPSAILTFRDEYPDLATDQNLEEAKKLSNNVFFIDEFIAREIDRGNITSSSFTQLDKSILLHGHCQQKAVGSVADSLKILSLPVNFKVSSIPSGCCGMAGSFGYEKEHYDVSMKIGELVLFPAVRKNHSSCTIAAPGTSCRHQIKDGTGVRALHTVEILYDALV
jgi:Fe-S oxidoreductase